MMSSNRFFNVYGIKARYSIAKYVLQQNLAGKRVRIEAEGRREFIKLLTLSEGAQSSSAFV
jgi:hypothetical protein